MGLVDFSLYLLLVDSLLVLELANLLLHFDIVLVHNLSNLALDVHLEEFRIFTDRLAIISLQVLEEALGADLDIGNLDCLEPDSPTLDHLEHFLPDSVSQQLSVREHLVDS